MVKCLTADTSSQLNLLRVGRGSRCLTILLMSVSLETRRMVSYIPTQALSFCFQRVHTSCTCANRWPSVSFLMNCTFFTCVEPRHSSKEALNQTGLRNEENTSDKQSGKSKSPKFVSPFKSQGNCLRSCGTNNLLAIIGFICSKSAVLRRTHWESTTSSNRPQIGPTSSNLDAPPNFNGTRA